MIKYDVVLHFPRVGGDDGKQDGNELVDNESRGVDALRWRRRGGCIREVRRVNK